MDEQISVNIIRQAQDVEAEGEVVQNVSAETIETGGAMDTNVKVTNTDAIFDVDSFFEANREKLKQVIAEVMGQVPGADEQAADIKKKAIELEEKERLLNFKQLQLDTIAQLEQEGLPTGIMRLVIGEDMDATTQNIAIFKAEFYKAVGDAVNQRLSGNRPIVSRENGFADSGPDRKSIRKIMSGRRK